MKKFLAAFLAVLTCLFLMACAPADQYKAMEKMEEAGYKVSISDEASTEFFVGETGVATVSASKSEGGITNLKVYTLTAYLFESAQAAKAYYEDIKDDADEETVIKVSGSWVIRGDKDSVDAFLK